MNIKSITKVLIAASLIGATLVGCAPSISPNSYGPYSTGQVNRTMKGVIYSSRVVTVQGTSTIGTLAGGAVGAIAGSAIGGGRGSILTAIGGGLLGAGVGNVMESKLTTRNAMEYVVKTPCGSYLTVVQGLCPSYQIGQHVLVIFGDQARIIPDPNY